jgi:hypothetical protein
MNMNKIESVDVDQTLLGRLFGKHFRAAPHDRRATEAAYDRHRGVTAAPFRVSGPSRFCPASAERRRIWRPSKSATLFEKRAARRMPDCENLDRLGIYAVKQTKRKIHEGDDPYAWSLGDLGGAVRELQQSPLNCR